MPGKVSTHHANPSARDQTSGRGHNGLMPAARYCGLRCRSPVLGPLRGEQDGALTPSGWRARCVADYRDGFFRGALRPPRSSGGASRAPRCIQEGVEEERGRRSTQTHGAVVAFSSRGLRVAPRVVIQKPPPRRPSGRVPTSRAASPSRGPQAHEARSPTRRDVPVSPARVRPSPAPH